MSWYENGIGTFLELLAILFLLNLFSEEYLRHKVAIFFIGMIVATVDIIQNLFYSDYRIILLVDSVCILTMLKAVVKRRWSELIFEFFICFVAVSFFEFILIFIYHAFNMPYDMTFFMRLIHLSITLLFSWSVGCHKKLRKEFLILYERYKQIFYLIIGNLYLIFLLESYLWNNKINVFYSEIGLVAIVIMIWIFINVLLLKEYIQNRRKSDLIGIHENYIQMIENLLDNLQEEKHEFRKHLQTIEGFSHEDDSVNAIMGIQQYIKDLRGKEKETQEKQPISFLTGNRVTNALLSIKAKEASEKGISFFYVPSMSFPRLPFEQYELIELVGNLLNNAFEYVENLDMEERKVTLRIGEDEDEKSFIETRNVFHIKSQEPLHLMTQKGYSTKGQANRGYGLHHVKRIVEKYKGTFLLFQEDDCLVIRLLF
ncbi:MAG: GHKL domain-containing protein [Anaerovorax sp.]|nr:GHKL domain-containing protein [Anaerovorax sp.]